MQVFRSTMAEMAVPTRALTNSSFDTKWQISILERIFRVIYCANTFVQVLYVFRFINILPTQVEI